MESFLVGDRAEGIIRVDALVVDAKLREPVVRPKLLYSILCGVPGLVVITSLRIHWVRLTKVLPADDCRKVKVGWPMYSGNDPSFQVHGPSFV